MLKQRRDAARQLANRLFETESAIDEAISKMADLTGYMPIARSDANLSAVVGQEVISQAAVTLSVLVDVETHNRLADARDQIGLREVGFGLAGDKPAAQGNLEQRPVVSLVEEAAA